LVTLPANTTPGSPLRRGAGAFHFASPANVQMGRGARWGLAATISTVFCKTARIDHACEALEREEIKVWL